MTIEIAVKVHDGLVLAADSATTLVQRDSSGQTRETNIYNNANKVMNLFKGLPIGLMSWGLGSIGSSSISTLGKDLRRRLQGEDSDYPDWAIDPSKYSIEEIAIRVREFFYEENYLTTMPAGVPPVNPLGLLIGGYSSNGNQAEVFTLNADENGCTPPSPTLTQEYGAVWSGQPEAITRLNSFDSVQGARRWVAQLKSRRFLSMKGLNGSSGSITIQVHSICEGVSHGRKLQR